MNLILGWISALIAPSVLKVLFQRVAAALGMSVVSFVGVSALLNIIENTMTTQFNLIPASAMIILRMAGVDRAMSVMLSAIVTKMSMAGLTNAGAIRRIFWMGKESTVLLP